MDSKLKKYLEKIGVEYEEFRHKPVFRVSDSRKLKKEIPGLHCKTLFLRDNNKKFYLVGMKADKMLDTKKLRAYLRVRKLHFGTAEELREKIALIPGSVSIFGAINNPEVKLILTEDVWNAEKTGFHPNINTSTIVLTHSNLKKFYECLENEKEIADI